MIDIAIDAAKAAGTLAQKYFNSHLKISFKSDDTPVTIADKKAEKLARAIIGRKFPKHGIIGEEFNPINSKSRFTWIIDPIDGTRDFSRKIASWGTFVALLYDQKPIIGVYFAPMQNELFVAERGKGTYLNNKKTRVSKVSNLKLSCISHGALTHFKKTEHFKGFLKLCDTTLHKRGFGTLSINFLLKGNIEVYMDTANGIYDTAAPSILIEEAGGKFTDFKGTRSLTSGSYVLTNGLLHNQVIKILNS